MNQPEGSIGELSAALDVPYPNPAGYTDCSAVMVVWNEQERLPALLELMRHWFEAVVVGVQESTDDTMAIAMDGVREHDQVLAEPHTGMGDSSMPRLIGAVRTHWSFVVAADEMPSEDLLQSLWSATAYAERNNYDGLWIPFRSLVDGVGSNDTQTGHLRLFRSNLGWPGTMHSRPTARHDLWWPFGHILHSRTLDEMMQDYLRYFALGRENLGWSDHNKLMMHDACAGVAQVLGWQYVQSYEWWPEVRAIAFDGKDPA